MHTGEGEGQFMGRGLDFIGDVHGHATALVLLLERLGYRIVDKAWRHPSRIAIFVGDLIDRGPEQLRTVDIVRRMVESGAARCLMGNHEYNAIAWMTPHPHHPDEFLRAHNHRHHHQHKAFLAEVEGDASLHRDLIEWFARLPIWLELDGCRVVHACWDERQMELLRPHVDADGRLERSMLEHSMLKGSHEHQAIEVLLKGPEATLPPGVHFHDKYGHMRREVRLAWWNTAARSFRQAALLMKGLALEAIPDEPLPEKAMPKISSGGPVFFGHYWRTGQPQVLAPGFACVDYSAGRGDPLVAYRWDGEIELRSEKFVSS
jgi:hypothetical protein